jgi:hypothetical protein
MVEGIAIELGGRIWFEYREWDVLRLTVDEVLLKRVDDAQLRGVSLAALQESPTLASEEQSAPGVSAMQMLVDVALWEELDASTQELARQKAAEMLEAYTGYRSGSRSRKRPCEPRPEYDPSLPRKDRLQAKVDELVGRDAPFQPSIRTLERWKRNYDSRGLPGLVRQRSIKDPLHHIDRRFSETLREVIDDATELSSGDAMRIFTETVARVDARYGPGAVRIPGRTRFYEILNALTRRRATLGDARTRASIARRRARSTNPWKPTRSGEVLQTDSTIVDVLVVDDHSGKIGRPEFAIATDPYDDCVVAARVTMEHARAIDAALLLYDAMTPKPMRAGWDESTAWSIRSVPSDVIVELEQKHLRGERMSNIPFGSWEYVVTDRGRIYLSHTFINGCAHLQISHHPAPAYMPNYKGVVERFFDRANHDLWQYLPGYTGAHPARRGKAPANYPLLLLFRSRLEELFWEWIATEYLQTPHDGCRPAFAPAMTVPPLWLREESTNRNGFIVSPPAPQDLIALLPSHWCSLNHYGVDVDRLRYDAPIVRDYEHEPSPYRRRSRKTGREEWLVHSDPRDRRRVFLPIPQLGEVFELDRVGADDPDLPVSQASVAWAVRSLVEEGIRRPTELEVSRRVNALLSNHIPGYALPAAEQRVLIKAVHDVAAATKDRQRAAPTRTDDASARSPRQLAVRERLATDGTFASVDVDDEGYFDVEPLRALGSDGDA